MLCEVCKTNNAVYFYKQTRNGVTKQKNLCSECAKKLGMEIDFMDFSGFGDDLFGGFLGGLLEPKPFASQTESCPKCGMTMPELLNGGRVGCSKCYEVFRKALSPTITKIHGKATHCGKRPGKISSCPEVEQKSTDSQSTSEKPTVDRLTQLKQLLNNAIENQEYEDAAKYRDEIREIESKQSKERDE